jgi:hypothetical protein
MADCQVGQCPTAVQQLANRHTLALPFLDTPWIHPWRLRFRIHAKEDLRKVRPNHASQNLLLQLTKTTPVRYFLVLWMGAACLKASFAWMRKRSLQGRIYGDFQTGSTHSCLYTYMLSIGMGSGSCISRGYNVIWRAVPHCCPTVSKPTYFGLTFLRQTVPIHVSTPICYQGGWVRVRVSVVGIT